MKNAPEILLLLLCHIKKIIPMKDFIEVTSCGKKHTIIVANIAKIENSAKKQSYIHIIGCGQLIVDQTYEEVLALLKE